MPRARNPRTIDTFDGLFFFHPDDNVNLFVTADKEKVDKLKAELRGQYAEWDRFWAGIKQVEGADYVPPSIQNSSFAAIRRKLEREGRGELFPQVEKIRIEISRIQNTLHVSVVYARKWHDSISKAKTPEARQEVIARAIAAIAKNRGSTVPTQRTPGKIVDEYALEEHAKVLLDRYPADQIAHLLRMCEHEPDSEIRKECKASIQGDMLLLENIIKELKAGFAFQNWEVEIPSLDSKEYSHIEKLRDSDVLSTKDLSTEQKKALFEQAQKELDEEVGSVYVEDLAAGL